MKYYFWMICVFGICACITTYPSIKEIETYDSKDHEIIIGMINTLQSSLNDRDVDKWFDLYTDDAIITYIKNRPTPKKEVIASVQDQDISTWKFIIDDIKIVDTKIEENRAKVKTILKMNTEGSIINHPETYYFTKRTGNWLIEKETNP